MASWRRCLLADLVARLGRPALTWQAIARGEDIGPLVPTLESERFESSLELEWPIEGLEPLSFVLTRLLEPLSTRLERRDRGAAVLHILLRLVTRDASGTGWEEHARRLQLPTPMRDVRTLRTLALLDLESHPPAAAIDRVRIVIDPTPGRVLQHTLFARRPANAGTAVDAGGAAGRADGPGSLWRAGARRYLSPGRVRDDGVQDGSRRVRGEREIAARIRTPAPCGARAEPAHRWSLRCVAAVTPCRRASWLQRVGRCVSRPIAAALPAARSRAAPDRGGRLGTGGQDRREGQEGQDRQEPKRYKHDRSRPPSLASRPCGTETSGTLR